MVKFYYMNKKTVVLFIRGFPGSGKTTISKHVAQKFDFKHINPDFLPNLYEKSDRRERLRKFDLCAEEVKSSLSDSVSVVWDQPWRKAYNINRVINSLKENYKFKPLIIELTIPIEVSWERSKDKFAHKKEFDKFVSKYLNLSINYPKLLINTENDYEKNIQKIEEFLEYNITHG